MDVQSDKIRYSGEVKTSLTNKVLDRFKSQGLFRGKVYSVKHETELSISKSQLKAVISKGFRRLDGKDFGSSTTVKIRRGFRTKKIQVQILKNVDGTPSVKLHYQKEGKELGAGSYGVVTDSMGLHTGRREVKKTLLFGGDDLAKERDMLETLHKKIKETPGLEKLITPSGKAFLPIIKPPSGFEATETGEVKGIYLEKGTEGTLFNALGESTLTQKDKVQIFQDVLTSVQILESCDFHHLDLKPDNIVIVEVGGEKRAKLIDFGNSNPSYGDMPANQRRPMPTGAPRYMDAYSSDVLQHYNVIIWNGDDPERGPMLDKEMTRRDRVALSRVLVELVLNPEQIQVFPADNNTSARWEPKFGDNVELKEIYDFLNQIPGDGVPLPPLSDLQEKVAILLRSLE
ncbi:MAG: hypothetical protein Q8K75_05180 [Chlamydiales bacterium]|nr:hypothetical protein [Chlamydiales bacterium]